MHSALAAILALDSLRLRTFHLFSAITLGMFTYLGAILFKAASWAWIARRSEVLLAKLAELRYQASAQSNMRPHLRRLFPIKFATVSWAPLQAA